MGSESSVPERPDSESGRSRSASPFERREAQQNNWGDDDGMDGLPRYPSTMPEHDTEPPGSPDLLRWPASEPDGFHARGDRSSPKKKKKKKKRRESDAADAALEPIFEGDKHPNPEHVTADSAGEETIVPDSSPKKRKQKKKKKQRASSSSQHLPGDDEIDQMTDQIAELGSPIVMENAASQSLPPRSPKKSKKSQRRNRDLSHELPPSSQWPTDYMRSSPPGDDTEAEHEVAELVSGSHHQPELDEDDMQSAQSDQNSRTSVDVEAEQELAEFVSESLPQLEIERQPPTESESEANAGESAAEDQQDTDIPDVQQPPSAKEVTAPEESEVESDGEDAPTKTPVQATPPRRQSRQKPGIDVYQYSGSPVNRNRTENLATKNSDAPSSPPKSSAKTPGSRGPRRKAKTPFFVREEEENANAFSELPGDGVAEPAKTPRVTKKAKEKKAKSSSQSADVKEDLAPVPDGQYRSGALSAVEEQQVRGAIEQFRKKENLTEQELISMIHENPQYQKDTLHQELWSSVDQSLPARPRRKLMNWCRQNFHNFVARGRWTKEQDEELLEVFKKHPKKWSVIGGLINRHPNDVRDRYRNYLICRDTIKLDYWTKEEEERLYDAVQAAADKIRESNDFQGGSLQGLINWEQVSQAMDYTRSRLQCMKKWKQLGEDGKLRDDLTAILPPSSTVRLQNTRNDLKRITLDDKFRLVSAIRASKATKDNNIPWKEIVKDLFEDEFERKALVTTWARLRHIVPDQKSQTTEQCATYLCDMYGKEGAFLGDGIGDHKESGLFPPSQSQRSSRSGTPSSSMTAAKNKAKGYRAPRSNAGRKSAAPAGRLSEQAMAHDFRSKKHSIPSSTDPVQPSGNTRDDTDEAIEESDQEEDIDASPRESTPEPKDTQMEDAPESPELTSAARDQRAPSVDLGIIATSSQLPTSTPLPPTSGQSKSKSKTYSAKERRRQKGLSDSKADTVEHGKRKKKELVAEEESEEGEPDQTTPRPKEKAKKKRKEKDIALAAHQLDEGALTKTPLRGKRNRLSEATTLINDDGASSPQKKRKTAAAAGQDETATTRRTSISSPAKANTKAKVSTPKKKSKKLVASTQPAPASWNAVNSPARRIPATQPAETMSVASSDIDEDMEDIPARIAVSQVDGDVFSD